MLECALQTISDPGPFQAPTDTDLTFISLANWLICKQWYLLASQGFVIRQAEQVDADSTIGVLNASLSQMVSDIQGIFGTSGGGGG